MRDQRTNQWVITAIAAFVVADIVLVWFALSSTRSATAGASGTPEVLPTVQADATPTPTPTPEPDFTVEPLGAVLGAVDTEVAYRAVTGECPATPAALEITTDGGATWSPTTPLDATSIQQVIAGSADVFSVVAAETDGCAPVLFRTFSQGLGWQQTDEVATRWHLTAGQAIAPGGDASTPCPAPVQLAQRDDSTAAVLCGDATVASTTDAGASWTASEPIDGAASIAPSGDAYLVAAREANGCSGVQVVSLTPALEVGTLGSCLPSDAEDGATTLATADDGTIWIWSGDVVARSSDGGSTW